VGVRERVVRLEERVRADTSLSPPEPDDRCPRCGRTDLREPDKEELLTLASPAWTVPDLEAADAELSTSISSPYACLAWCPVCARLVVVRTEDVGLEEYPPRHERDRQLLRCLVPCPYWAWCLERKCTTCDHCSGKGILERDEPEEAEGPTPPAPSPTPGAARLLPTGPRELPPLPEGADPADYELVWEGDGDVQVAEEAAGQGGAG
jgi:hypothetical protein